MRSTNDLQSITTLTICSTTQVVSVIRVVDWKSSPDDGRMEYAIVDEDKHLLGFFSYHIDWYSSCAHWFGLFAFDRGSSLVGFDVYKELEKLIHQYHLHRIEWRMIGGNPVERHYDKFCQKYNGKKFVLTDATKDRYGNYHDDVIYEIILPNFSKLD